MVNILLSIYIFESDSFITGDILKKNKEINQKYRINCLNGITLTVGLYGLCFWLLSKLPEFARRFSFLLMCHTHTSENKGIRGESVRLRGYW